MMKRAYRQTGFSLIEMMMILAIIGVLTVMSWAAFTPSSGQYDPRATANLIAGAFKMARLRAIGTGLCHEVIVLSGTKDWQPYTGSPYLVAAGGYTVHQGNSPVCPVSDSDTAVQFGAEDILDYTGSSYGWVSPKDVLRSVTGLQIPKPVGANQKDQTTWVTAYGVRCCTKDLDGAGCTAMTNPLYNIQDPIGIVFFFHPDGKIRLLNYSGYASYDSYCTSSANHYTVHVGTEKFFNNNLKVTQTGAKNITSLQYSVVINGNTGNVDVNRGW